MKVAIIGCGNIADTHAQALRQQGQHVVLAVGRTLASAGRFAEKWGVAQSADSYTPEADDGIDCVHICTPPALHFEMARQVLEAGKHLVCEKPLTLDATEARTLWQLAMEKGVLAAVNFNVRFHEACARAKEIVTSADFGNVQLISGRYFQEFHLLPADYMWRYMPELGGKMRAVTEIGSHWIDLARYWTGLEVEAVSATFGCFAPQRKLDGNMMYPPEHPGGQPLEVATEDVAAVTLRFTGGALGSMLLSEVSSGRSNYLSMEVSSARTALWWNSEDPYRLNQGNGKFCGSTTAVNAFGGGFPDTFSRFFEQVYSALESGRFQMEGASFPTLYDGYVNAAVCQAIWESAQNQSQWVEVKV